MVRPEIANLQAPWGYEKTGLVYTAKIPYNICVHHAHIYGDCCGDRHQ